MSKLTFDGVSVVSVTDFAKEIGVTAQTVTRYILKWNELEGKEEIKPILTVGNSDLFSEVDLLVAYNAFKREAKPKPPTQAQYDEIVSALKDAVSSIGDRAFEIEELKQMNAQLEESVNYWRDKVSSMEKEKGA